jgi:hypothetical protein
MAQQTVSQYEEIKKRVKDVKLYINGEFVDAESHETFENINPFKMNSLMKLPREIMWIFIRL